MKWVTNTCTYIYNLQLYYVFLPIEFLQSTSNGKGIENETPESRGTTRIRRTPTESCLHLQRDCEPACSNYKIYWFLSDYLL